MAIAVCIVYVLIVAVLVAWLLYELREDSKPPQKPTVPAPEERLPPRVDL